MVFGGTFVFGKKSRKHARLECFETERFTMFTRQNEAKQCVLSVMERESLTKEFEG